MPRSLLSWVELLASSQDSVSVLSVSAYQLFSFLTLAVINPLSSLPPFDGARVDIWSSRSSFSSVCLVLPVILVSSTKLWEGEGPPQGASS